MAQEFAPGVFRIVREEGYCPFSVGGDTYRGCVHNCLYCFERQCNNQHLRKGGNAPMPRDYNALFRSLYEDIEVRKFTIDRHIPVRLGEMDDRVTLNLFRLLDKAGIGCITTTKAPHRVGSEYIDAIGPMSGVIKVSFSTFDDARARILEPGAIPPSRRLAEMRRIKQAGISVVARLNPYLFTESMIMTYSWGPAMQ
jgi:DNA repair photolyase